MNENAVLLDKEKLEAATVDPLVSEFESRIDREALALIGWGALNIVLPNVSAPFGLLLIIVGVASYRLRRPAMYIVEAIVFLTAALTNLLVGGPIALLFAPILVVSAIYLIRQYRRFRHVRDETAGRFWPWLSLGLGLLAPLGFGMAVIAFVVVYAATGAQFAWVLPAVGNFFLQLGVLALGMGVVAVVESCKPAVVSSLAVLLGLVSVAIQIGSIMLSVQGGV